jgi:hypothetical protein
VRTVEISSTEEAATERLEAHHVKEDRRPGSADLSNEEKADERERISVQEEI